MRLTATFAGALAMAALAAGGASLAPAQDQDKGPEAPRAAQKKAGPREKGESRPRGREDRRGRPESPRPRDDFPPDPRETRAPAPELAEDREDVLVAREDVHLARARMEAARLRLQVFEQRLDVVRGEAASGGEEHRRRELEMHEGQARQAMEEARDRLTRLSREVDRPDDPNLVRAREEMEALMARSEKSRAELERMRASQDEPGPARRLALGEVELGVAEARVGLVSAEIDLARAERRLARAERDGSRDSDSPGKGDAVELTLDLEGVSPAVTEVLQFLKGVLEERGEREGAEEEPVRVEAPDQAPEPDQDKERPGTGP